MERIDPIEFYVHPLHFGRMPTFDVVVTDHDFDSLAIEEAVLDDVATVRDLSTVSEEAFDEALANAAGILNLRYSLPADSISRLDNCRIIARYGIGVDNVALDAAANQGMYVTNVPEYCVEEVANHAFALLLTLARGITFYDRSVSVGDWDRDAAAPLERLSTQTVGIVGFGEIGQTLAHRLDAFGIEVLASDPFLSEEDVAEKPAALVSFETLLRESDYVSIHSPLTDDTRDLFDERAFTQMKPSAALINVARGPIVDESALVAALDDGNIAAAGLDVFDPEPPRSDSPLRDHPQVVTTPHVAWYSEEANEERRQTAAECVRAALTGSKPANVIAGPNE